MPLWRRNAGATISGPIRLGHSITPNICADFFRQLYVCTSSPGPGSRCVFLLPATPHSSVALELSVGETTSRSHFMRHLRSLCRLCCYFPPTFLVLPSLTQHHGALASVMKSVISGRDTKPPNHNERIPNPTRKHGKQQHVLARSLGERGRNFDGFGPCLLLLAISLGRQSPRKIQEVLRFLRNLTSTVHDARASRKNSHP
jgi:hypothetical protein